MKGFPVIVRNNFSLKNFIPSPRIGLFNFRVGKKDVGFGDSRISPGERNRNDVFRSNEAHCIRDGTHVRAFTFDLLSPRPSVYLSSFHLLSLRS